MAIVIPIELDTHKLRREIQQTSSGLSRFGKLALLTAGAAAFGGLVETLRIGTHRFIEHEKVQVRTDAVIKSTGRAAHVTAKQVDELAKSIMAKSGIDNEQLQSGENILLQFRAIQNQTGKNNDIFNQATSAMADLSVVMGGNTTMAAKSLGKALQDPEHGFGALKRAGVTFTDSQKGAIKFLQEHNRTLEAQKIILEGVTRATGGQAAALGQTLQGKLNIASLTFKNLAMDIASSFLPSLATAATRLVTFFQDIARAPTLSAKVNVIVGSIKDAVGQSFSTFLDWWLNGKRSIVRGKNNELFVILVPSGEAQFAEWFHGLLQLVHSWGVSTGNALADAIAGGVSTKGKAKLWNAVNSIFNVVGQAAVVVNSGAMLAVEYMLSVTDTLNARFGEAIKEAIINAFKSPIGLPKEAYQKIVQGLFRRGTLVAPHLIDVPQMARIITADMKTAIQTARGSLAEAATSLGGMVGEIISATASKSGVYGNAADMSAEGQALEDRQLAIRERSLKQALAMTTGGSAEEAQAKLDLDQFYYDRRQIYRQRDVDAQTKSTQSQIEDLTTRFNQGIISAKTFYRQLDSLIGADAGDALGTSFAASFRNALKSIKNAVADIARVAGVSNPLAPDVGSHGPVSQAAIAAYRDALAKWPDLVKRAAKIRDDARSAASPGGATITPAEQRAIDRAAAAAKKPKRSDYTGMALGGILTGPKILAGEAGTEAVIPLGSPTAAQMMRKAFSDAVGGSSGDTIYNISVNAGMGSDGADIGRQVVEAIKVFERRNGPVFVSV
jgi:hypothetical protein